MYCRNCGKEIDDKAVVCTGCGVPPRLEKKFCLNCGVATQVNQAMCTKCGVSLTGVAGSSGNKSKVAAALFAIFLGNLGIHKFYLGYKSEGIITLVISFCCIPLIVACGLGAIGLGVIKIITFIEGIIYLTKSDEEFNRIYIEGKKGWF